MKSLPRVPPAAWKQLLDAGQPWARLFVDRASAVDDILLGEPPNHSGRPARVRVVRGKRCHDRDSLFQEWAAALQFPHYFGANFDALEDCLSDLSWAASRALVLFVTDVDAALPTDDLGFRVLIDVLAAAAESRGEQTPALPMRLLFHCEPHAVPIARARLAASPAAAATPLWQPWTDR